MQKGVIASLAASVPFGVLFFLSDTAAIARSVVLDIPDDDYFARASTTSTTPAKLSLTIPV